MTEAPNNHVIFEDRDYSHVVEGHNVTMAYQLVDQIASQGILAAIKRPFLVRKFSKLVVRTPNDPIPDRISDAPFEQGLTAPITPLALAREIAKK